jgi:hypothetical protein
MGFNPLIPPHKPFDYERLMNFDDLRTALYDIKGDIEIALQAVDKADLSRGVDDHMKAAMVLSGVEIKMTNFAAEMGRKFLNRA